MRQRPRVAVVDDHPLFRRGVVEALDATSGFEIAGEAGSAEEAVELVRRESPDILLLDLNIPGGGLSAAHAIASMGLPTRVVILTLSDSREDAAAALDAGVRGYVVKGVGSRGLIRILEEIMAGAVFLSPLLVD